MKAYEVIDASAAALDHPSALMVFWRVAMYASGTEGVCYASVDTLRRQTRLSERTVQRSLQVLVQAGMLVALEQPGRTTEYRVPPPPWHPRQGDTPATVSPTPDTVTPAPDTVAPDPESTVTGSGSPLPQPPPPPGKGALTRAEWVAEQALRELQEHDDPDKLVGVYERAEGWLVDNWYNAARPRRRQRRGLDGGAVTVHDRAMRDAPSGLKRREIADGLARAAQRWRVLADVPGEAL